LTYSPEHLPAHGSLNYDHPVLFMKRLRKEFGSGIRSFGCGEYGELLSRPHYHLCIFNFDFLDKKLWRRDAENNLFTSEVLQGLWPYGFSTVGDLTFESAAYVARYVTKKITGKRAAGHYEVVDAESGEVFTRLPEKPVCVSRRPGVGRGWYEKHGKFVRSHDFVVRNGLKLRPPKYYDRLHEKLDPHGFGSLKAERKEGGLKAAAVLEAEDADAYRKWTDALALGKQEVAPNPRLYVMEEVKEAQFRRLKRGFEDE
jgi:hypothetical protein